MADSILTPSAAERQIPALLPRRPVLRQLVSDRTALAGLLLLVLMFTAAAAAPLVAPRDPNEQDVGNRYAPVSLEHPLGTDNLGRDEFSRLVYGARISLFTALAVGVAILAIGIVVGSIAGFAGGILDGLLMRIVDVLLAFPSLLLALAITGMLGPGLLHLMIGMVAVWWTDYARLMRGLVLSMRERPFVESAQAVGLPGRLVAVRHVLPNIVGPVIVLGTLQTGRLLLALSALSFLGLGVQPPTAEWGAMLSEGQQYLASAPQLMVYPGIAITLAALGFNLLGDGLRDVLDPTMDN
ncbi:MAG: ABC transporter permease subunit [Actinomycetota bacterium]|nr:ABC transporter permease subunit [Actinomycetota bacterium]